MNMQTNNNISAPKVYKLEAIVYRQILHSENTGKEYYAMARVIGEPNAVSVTEVGGRGGGLFFCLLHNFIYHPTETCEGCRTALPKVAKEARVTSCDSP